MQDLHSPTAEEIRARTFTGTVPLKTYALAMGVKVRTAQTWAENGLPVIRIGRQQHVILDRAESYWRERNSRQNAA